MPKLSILTTCYNRERYLADCLNSILVSDFKDFEVIIVDDNSIDNSYSIALSFAANDSRVKVFRNKSNLGDYPNRNKAASLATGTYLKYVDADDLVYPHGLGVFVNCMDKFSHAGLGISLSTQDTNSPYPICLTPNETFRKCYLTNQSVFGASPLTCIIRKQAFEQVGGFSGERYIGDFELWHRMAEQFEIAVLPGGLAWYRQHENQESTDIHNSLNIRFMYARIAAKYIATTTKLTNLEKAIARRRLRSMWIKDCLRRSIQSRTVEGIAGLLHLRKL